MRQWTLSVLYQTRRRSPANPGVGIYEMENYLEVAESQLDYHLWYLLGLHPSQPYNPDIANAFFRAGEIEAWGRGIRRVMEACRAAETPEPRIRVEPGDFWFEFPFSKAYLERIGRREGRGTISGEGTLKGLGESPVETPVETSVEAETTQERILAVLRRNPRITRRELAEMFGLTSDGMKYHMDRLRRKGLIRHVGPRKSGHWEVREEP